MANELSQNRVLYSRFIFGILGFAYITNAARLNAAVAYAICEPYIQYTVDATNGPKDRPNCPRERKLPNTSPLDLPSVCDARVVSDVTTVPLVNAKNAAPTYNTILVCAIDTINSPTLHDMIPCMAILAGAFLRLTYPPWISADSTPIKASKYPCSLFEKPNRSKVRNVNVNSIPLNRNKKAKCSFANTVIWLDFGCTFSVFLECVSGR
jgi:hypothetical protein